MKQGMDPGIVCSIIPNDNREGMSDGIQIMISGLKSC